jgi:hypothetical protein
MLPKGTLEHAKRIRKSLVMGRMRFMDKNKHIRHPEDILDLGGVCGVASVLLCLAIGDTELKFLKGTDAHAWNEFPFPSVEKTMIVDITATQFKSDLITTDGVFIGTTPQKFHLRAYSGSRRYMVGHELFQFMKDDDWYTEPRPGATPGEIRRWRAACRIVTSPGVRDQTARRA